MIMAGSSGLYCILFLAFASTCYGLRCIRCEGTAENCKNSKETEDCAQFGSDQVCANFYYWSNGEAKSEKKCYQRAACERQEDQVSNDCGEHSGKDKPCRCCCTTNECNSLEKGCIKGSKCKKLKNPKVGKYDCPANLILGAVCDFICPDEYDLIGSETTKCKRQSTGKLDWDPKNQKCKKVRCSVIKAPEHGTVSCKNKGKYVGLPDFIYLKTECTFKCNPGYTRKGYQRTVCQSNNKWSKPVPTCEPETCVWFPKDPNRQHKCTNGNFVGSKCTFKCKLGYTLIGSNSTKCDVNQKNPKEKEWDKEPPKCVRIKCQPKQKDPPHGKVECTDVNLLGSVCTFTCDKGYDLDGTAANSGTSECIDDGDGDDHGEWSNPPSTCTIIKCMPQFTSPKNGNVKCTDKNFLDSVCTFRCNEGYDLDGTSENTLQSECKDDGDGNSLGEWTLSPAPTCTVIKCQPPHEDPENGKVDCTHDNYLGSVCTFRCNDFYDMDGTKGPTHVSECIKDKAKPGTALGKWEPGAGKCTIIKCRSVVKPENGAFVCSAMNIIRSTCTFKCDDDYELVGSESITCIDKKLDGDNKGEWSSKEPTCSRVFCKEQQHDNVIRVCIPPDKDTGRFPSGTVCTYTCAEEGHYMVTHETPDEVVTSGSLDVECKQNKKWSSKPPLCKPIQCRPLTKPANGYAPKCSNSWWYQSSCTFKCKPAYALSHDNSLVCESDGDDSDKMGKWNDKEPICKKNQCEPYKRVNNGKITYTDKLNIGSIAELKCNPGYTYKQYEDAECLDASPPGVPDWSREENVCCVKCLFNTRLKLVTVVDKTAGQTEHEWNQISTWHYYLLEQLFTSGYEVNYGMVLYDTAPDVANSMKLRKIKFYSDLEDVRGVIDTLPHGGSVSETGKALEYAKTKYFRRATKEEPYILFIRGVDSSDDEIPAAESIRSENLNLMSFGFRKGSWLAKKAELAEITGDEDNVFMIGGLADVARAGEVMTQISKDKGCDSSSSNAKCT